MRRDLLDKMIAWHRQPRRKPLILMGARQVGKSWLMREFSRIHYPQDTVFLDVHDNALLRQAVSGGSANLQGLLEVLSTFSGHKIIPGKTLLVLDEIQESPPLLTSLKYFQEQLPQLAILAAGSLLGIALNRSIRGNADTEQRVSFPVGKVSFLDVPPMTFAEFLDAVGETAKRECLDKLAWNTIASLQQSYQELLKRYYFVGGMPEAVAEYAQNRDFQAVRSVQQDILRSYDQDFAKHASQATLARIRLLWNSLPGQLAKENKKLVYTALRPGARARDYEVALQWLEDAGMVHQVHRVSHPGMPLKAYEDFSAFKLYAHDVGLLGAMSDLPPSILLGSNELFTHFKGAFTEQYVLQELVAAGLTPYYWTPEDGKAEIEFLLQGDRSIYPLEAKAETNLSGKSLLSYRQRYEPRKCLRTSLSMHTCGEKIDDLPLFALRQALPCYLMA